MKVSLSWLQSYVDLEMTVEQLTQMLTMAGLEVDSVCDRYGFLNSVLVGRIATVEPHPRADKLTLCQVDAGNKRYRVVCGAPNVAVDRLVPLALPGTELVDGTTLSPSTIRGERSEGMLCSAVELGLGIESSGLLVLDNALTPGTPLNQALALCDPVLDIDLTPNRPDCLSIVGIAREVAGYQGTALKRPGLNLPKESGDIHDHASVVIDAPDHCPRYTCRLIEKVKVGPSPFWLQDRLRSVDLRPINLIVDVTNFVMMEIGQPLHAFDFDRLAQNRIVVRTAREGELFTTLDEKERQLNAEMLMICDAENAVGIGGVMGGMNSEIEATTTRVLLEGAYFNPVSIRKTAKHLGLNTDAAHRFERGVDPHGTLFAVNRAAALIVQLAGATLVGGTIDVQYDLPRPVSIDLSVRATNRTLGTDLKLKKMAQLLNSIEFKAVAKDKDTLQVAVPSFRVDVSRPQDLMEEVARRWGYDNIPISFATIPVVSQPVPMLLARRKAIQNLLTGMGFSETINYSFIHKSSCDRLGLAPDDIRRNVVQILNPLTEEMAILRTSLVPGLLETVQRNLARQSKTLRLFETGKIFIGQGVDQQPLEKEMLAGLWTGQRTADGWHGKPKPCDYYDLKGALESLLIGLHAPEADYAQLPAQQCTYTQPGATARIEMGGKILGLMGEVHPRVREVFDLKQAVFIFEIDLQALVEQIPEVVCAQPLPKYPATNRDATLIIDQTVAAGDLLAQVRLMDQPLVEAVQLFDVYQGGSLPKNRKSVSFRIVYRSSQETLEDNTVNQLHKEITEQLVIQFKADLPT
jgi:phenylalanyl-tRNA synthetase beta chain